MDSWRRCSAMMCLLFLACTLTQAQVQTREHYIKPSQIGTEFYFSVPPNIANDSLEQINISMSSQVACHVVIEGTGGGQVRFKEELDLRPNVQETRSIPIHIAQPRRRRDFEIPEERIYSSAAVQISATAPIAVSFISDAGPNAEGTLLLPVSSFGKEYFLTTSGDASQYYGKIYPAQYCIVAAYDSTSLVIEYPGESLNLRTVGGLGRGAKLSILLNKGDVYYAATAANAFNASFSGTKIRSNKPVGVLSGNSCGNAGYDIRWCNYMVEMLMPSYTQGTAYFVPTVRGRRRSGLVEVMSAYDSTNIYLNGNSTPYITLNTPSTQSYTQLRISEQDFHDGLISSDKPIQVTYYNPGMEDDNVRSSPFQMNLLPVQQYATEASVQVPAHPHTSAPYFPNNYLLIAFRYDERSYQMPTTLEIGWDEGNGIEWHNVRTTFDATFSRMPNSVDGKFYGFKTIALSNNNNAHTYYVRDVNPLAVYIYGSKTGNSPYYAYVGSALSKDLSKPGDVLPPIPDFTFCSDCRKINALVTDVAVNNLQRSNLGKALLLPQSSNVLFNVKAFIPGESYQTEWYVEVLDTAKKATAVIAFSDAAGNDTTITIEWAAAIVVPKPSVIASKELEFCAGESLELTAPNGYARYEWNTGESGRTISVSNLPEKGFGITVKVYDNAGRSATSDPVYITIHPVPNPSLKQVDSLLGLSNITPDLSYQWYKNGLLIAGAVNRTLIIKESGEYGVRVKNEHGCSTYIERHFDYIPPKDFPNGVEEMQDIEVRLYPNPARAKLRVEYQAQSATIIEIINTTGEVLLSFSAEEGDVHKALDISSLPIGMYGVRIYGAHTNSFLKFMKE